MKTFVSITLSIYSVKFLSLERKIYLCHWKTIKYSVYISGTTASLRAATSAAAGGMDGNIPVRLPRREGDGSRQIHHAKSRCGRRRGQAGSFGIAAKLAVTTDGLGKVRGRPGQTGDRGSDGAAYTGLWVSVPSAHLQPSVCISLSCILAQSVSRFSTMFSEL